MNTYLIKREVAKDGLPKRQDSYMVILVDDQTGGEYISVSHFEASKNCFIYDSDYSKLTHWYEPTTLSEIIEERMPKEGERKKEVEKIRKLWINSRFTISDILNKYHNYLKTKLTKE